MNRIGTSEPITYDSAAVGDDVVIFKRREKKRAVADNCSTVNLWVILGSRVLYNDINGDDKRKKKTV